MCGMVSNLMKCRSTMREMVRIKSNEVALHYARNDIKSNEVMLHHARNGIKANKVALHHAWNGIKSDEVTLLLNGKFCILSLRAG